MRQQSRVALVTGAGSGIGRATALALGREGLTVIATDIDASRLEVVIGELREEGISADGIQMDVSDESSVRDAMDRSIGTYQRLDILVNNAASWPSDGLLDMDSSDWDRDIGVCLRGPFLTCKTALRQMVAQGSGSIVNISSVNGLEFMGAEAYSAAKAGVISLTKSIAVRYGPNGVRANAVAPATIRTPIWEERRIEDPSLFERLAGLYPLGRVGEPEDVAEAVRFLSSSQANWITGVVLPVDGGLLAGRVEFTRP